MYSNREILGAVLAKWLEPVVSGLLMQKLLSDLPIVKAIDAKVRNTGWVSNGWSITSEIEPLIAGTASTILQPLLSGMLSTLPEESVSGIARGVVGKAVERGELSLFEGKITFDSNDLQRLKHLMDVNLPITTCDTYEVKE